MSLLHPCLKAAVLNPAFYWIVLHPSIPAGLSANPVGAAKYQVFAAIFVVDFAIPKTISQRNPLSSP